jgi:tetratricopeptide (TPR) repeat protein/transcriptional regulator with XRE-family HTH domain
VPGWEGTVAGLGLTDVTDVGELASVLRQLRRRDGRRRGTGQLTYRQLTDLTGWSIGTISSYLSGKVLPPTGRFDELARVLGASPAELGALATARDRVEESRRAGPVWPCQLPADAPHFTGRAAQLRQLDAALGQVPAITITGTAGAGKSTLAVRWAHGVREQFPDGQLYLNLRGYAAAPPLRPIEVVSQALRSLGVPTGRVPVPVDEASALYRSLVAGRRLLVLLDDARTAAQVRPVLPATPGVLVLVTSRDQLPGLAAVDGARQIGLDVLTEAEALDVLAAGAGAGRIAADRAAAAELASACAYLPLALRIAAASLASRPHLTVTGYLRRLGAAQHRLSALEADGDSRTAVRGAFHLSYRAVAAPARQLFRLLGLISGPDISEDAAVALSGADPAEAVRAIDQLCAAHLLTQTGPDRFALHELLRCYAAERAAAEDPPESRDAALDRLGNWYEAGARSASEALHPERVRLRRARPAASWASSEALSWLAAEQPNLLAVARQGGPAAWRILDSVRAYCGQSVSTADWQSAADAALAAATSAGDAPGEASAHLNLAEIARRTGDYAAAIGHYERAAALSACSGWTEGEAAALGNLGTICRYAGRVGEAVAHLGRSADLNRLAGRTSGLAAALGGLGIAHREQGDLDAAATRLRAALELYRDAGSSAGSAAAFDNLGETLLAQGRLDEAMTCFRQALTLFRSLGDGPDEALALCGMAAVHSATGRGDAALELAERAMVIGWETSDARFRLDVLLTLATVHIGLGRIPDAAARYEEALRLAVATGNRYPETAALVGLAELDRRSAAPARRALELATRCGYRILARRAENLLQPVSAAD